MLNKKLGQHFLRDEAVCAQLLAAIAPAAGQTILEIGSGGGALTDLLVESGACVCALEVDEKFAAQLQAKYRERGSDHDRARVRIVHADALTADWRALVGKTGARVRLAGNLPYYISTPLLMKMTQNAGWLQDAHLMVQEEVAQRLCAAAGGRLYGRLSVSVQLFFRAEYLFAVPPQAFAPPPQVGSAVVHLLPLAAPALPPAFWQVLAAAFNQRRKTLKNALAQLPMDWADCPIQPQRRAETLSVREFIALAQHCAPAPAGDADGAADGEFRGEGKGL